MKDGGPAFPHVKYEDSEGRVMVQTDDSGKMTPLISGDYPGMSLRDYFAAKAMSGMMMEFVKHGYPENDQAQELRWMVNASWIIADAMLEARYK